MWSSVDLPAPFGPSRPVTPGPRANEMSLTATTLPYQRETWSSASAGTTVAAGAGPAARSRGRQRRGRRRPAGHDGLGHAAIRR